jgi:hypothetical protein
MKRDVEIGEIVRIWPDSYYHKYSDFIYGVCESVYEDVYSKKYKVFADGKLWEYLIREEIFVDDEIATISKSRIADEFVYIQPMTQPSSLVFYMDYKFEKSKKIDQ